MFLLCIQSKACGYEEKPPRVALRYKTPRGSNSRFPPHAEVETIASAWMEARTTGKQAVIGLTGHKGGRFCLGLGGGTIHLKPLHSNRCSRTRVLRFLLKLSPFKTRISPGQCGHFTLKYVLVLLWSFWCFSFKHWTSPITRHSGKTPRRETRVAIHSCSKSGPTLKSN